MSFRFYGPFTFSLKYLELISELQPATAFFLLFLPFGFFRDKKKKKIKTLLLKICKKFEQRIIDLINNTSTST